MDLKNVNYKKTVSVSTLVLIIVLVIAVPTFIIASDSTARLSRVPSRPSELAGKELIWEQTYGGSGDDRCFDVLALEDHGFLLTGSSKSFADGKTLPWIVRTDPEGNTVWNRTFDMDNGGEFRYAARIDKNFLLVGNAFLPSGDSIALIMKVDDQGNVIWSRTFEGKGAGKIFSAVTSTDGFYLFGLTYRVGNVGSVAWLIRTDENGNLLWNQTYDVLGESAFRSALLDKNQDLVITGYGRTIETENYQFLLVKIDAEGTVLLSRTYGTDKSERAYAITDSEDGYVIVGQTQTSNGDVDGLVVKTDLTGTLVWQKTCGGEKDDVLNAVVHSYDGGYVIAGYTFSFGKGQRDFWIFKIDESGRLIWNRVCGREGFEEAYGLVEVTADEFAVVGWTSSIGHGNYDYYMIEMKVSGANDGFSLSQIQ
jgi:hypothetical protein